MVGKGNWHTHTHTHNTHTHTHGLWHTHTHTHTHTHVRGLWHTSTVPHTSLKEKFGQLSILSFWRNGLLGHHLIDFPLVWEKSSNWKWLKTALEKPSKYRYFERRFQPLSVGGFFSNQRESISWCPKSPFPSKTQNRPIARTSPLNWHYHVRICLYYLHEKQHSIHTWAFNQLSEKADGIIEQRIPPWKHMTSKELAIALSRKWKAMRIETWNNGDKSADQTHHWTFGEKKENRKKKKKMWAESLCTIECMLGCAPKDHYLKLSYRSKESKYSRTVWWMNMYCSCDGKYGQEQGRGGVELFYKQGGRGGGDVDHWK